MEYYRQEKNVHDLLTKYSNMKKYQQKPDERIKFMHEFHMWYQMGDEVGRWLP